LYKQAIKVFIDRKGHRPILNTARKTVVDCASALPPRICYLQGQIPQRDEYSDRPQYLTNRTDFVPVHRVRSCMDEDTVELSAALGNQLGCANSFSV